MKITYIIAPFDSSEYLVRCINSIKRQSFTENEIIIAENSFYKCSMLDEYLAAIDNLKVISDNPKDNVQKIKEAVSMVSHDSVFIKLISVDTVAVSIASAEAQNDAEIIITVCAEKSGDRYRVAEKNTEFESSKLSFQNLFIKKQLFLSLEDKIFTEKQLFELWLDEQKSNGVPMFFSDEICFYTTDKLVFQDIDSIEFFISCKDRILNIVKKSLSINSVMIFDKYLSKLLDILFNDMYEISQKKKIFSIIKEMGEAAQNNELAKQLYKLYLESDSDFVKELDAEDYLLYISRRNSFAKKSFYQTAISKQVIPEPASKLSSPKPDPIVTEIVMLKNDIAALSKNMHFVFNAAYAAGGEDRLTDPVNQVPELFSQGKLGMKVIIKSIKEWITYKFSRKK